MSIRPEELENADVTDVETTVDLLARAAQRIRDLEQHGVRAVGGTVAEMLDQAIRSGDEIREKATNDATSMIENASRLQAEAESERAITANQAKETMDAALAEAACLRDEARAHSTQVLAEAQARLDQLLAAERAFHDRLTQAMVDIGTVVGRNDFHESAELELTNNNAELAAPGDRTEAERQPFGITSHQKSA